MRDSVSLDGWWSLPLLAAAGLCVFIALRVAEGLWWRPRRLEKHFARQGIRGPPYRFFVGCLKELVGLMMEASSKPMSLQNPHDILQRVLPFYHHWRKTYGSTFLLWFGPTARVTVADPDLIREIFLSRAELFEKYEAPPLLHQQEGDGLLNLSGEKWALHKKILTPTFHTDNLKLLIPFIGATVMGMVDKLRSSGELEIDVSEWFQTVAEDGIARVAFGRSVDEGLSVFQLQSQQMLFAAEAFRKVFIPGYRFLPTKMNARSWRLEKEIRRRLAALIRRRREIISDDDSGGAGGGDRKAKDLLGVMLNAEGITAGDIVEECKTFFFAGKQTTSYLLTWATVLLAMHPDWQERGRAEVLRVCGSRDVPTRDQLADLKTLGLIIQEVLRLYPPTAATIRRARADVELGGYRIPRGTELLIPIMAVHHDEELWGPDAVRFDPERFAGGASRAARIPHSFIPFGLGARVCIGQNLALLETKLTLAIILQRLSFRLSPSYVHAPTVLLFVYPQYGAQILFRSLDPGA
ncbi:Cytochrome P450 [Canna indica]|uniref:Cytochrome P450 n=1 Tax=Canna indica TaxID=4628 RepID=A0AAQ3KHC4_9LILI|nr:Cytochrome P450 [Canna indica]